MQNSKKLPSYRHLMFLLGCCMITAVSIGVCINAYGVFLTPVSDALGVGRGDISVHATLSALATGLLSPLAIKLLKRVRLKRLCVVGILLMALSTFLMAYAPSALAFDVLGILRGVSLATISMTVITTAIGKWFVKGRSTVTGIAMAFSGASGALASPLITSLIEQLGYASAYRIIALAMLVLTLPTTLLFITDAPEDVGETAYGSGELTSAAVQAGVSHSLQFKSGLFILLGVFAFLVTSVTSLTQHISGYALSVGCSASTGALLLSCIMVGNIASKLIIGFISERMGAFLSSTSMMIVCLAGLILLLTLPGSTTMLYTGSVLFGCIYSVSAVGISNIVHSMYGTEQYGKAYATVSMLTCVGSAISLSIFGYFYDLTGSYRFTILVSIGLIALCIFMTLVLSRKTKASAK